MSAIGSGKEHTLIPLKMMIPEQFQGDAKQWRKWKKDVEAYVEAVSPTLKKDMLIAKKIVGDLDSEAFLNAGGSEFEKGRELSMFLKSKCAGDAASIIESSGGGFEAWRNLCAHYEPELLIRESVVTNEFSMLCKKAAKDVNELKQLMLLFDQRRNVGM